MGKWRICEDNEEIKSGIPPKKNLIDIRDQDTGWHYLKYTPRNHSTMTELVSGKYKEIKIVINSKEQDFGITNNFFKVLQFCF